MSEIFTIHRGEGSQTPPPQVEPLSVLDLEDELAKQSKILKALSIGLRHMVEGGMDGVAFVIADTHEALGRIVDRLHELQQEGAVS